MCGAKEKAVASQYLIKTQPYSLSAPNECDSPEAAPVMKLTPFDNDAI
jgi:hypothetical protein